MKDLSPRAIPNTIGASIVVSALARHGVKAIFGQSNPSQVNLEAAAAGIRQIGYRTENAGVAMADGYSRISHKVGVVAAQNGPAATLLVPGLAEALKSSIPILALVQDVRRPHTDKNAFQEFDHQELFKGCAKWIRRVDRIERIDDYVDLAFTAAVGGRPGPAVLILPVDLLAEAGGINPNRAANIGCFPLDRPVANPADVEKAAYLLAKARSPLIIAGGGIHVSDAAAELAALQEQASLPVATTTMGKGSVDEGHPLSVGVVGYYMGTRSATKYCMPLVKNADVILLVGNKTNQNGTDSWHLYPPEATYIHLDIDPQEIGRNYEAQRLVGDAKATLLALTQALVKQDLSRRQAARPKLEKMIAEARQAHAKEAKPYLESSAAPIRPERLMADIDRMLTPDTIVVADASYSTIWACNFLKSRKPGMRFVSPRGLAGLGWGVPLALGAKLASPDRVVLNVSGDGGFAHVWSELETSRRMNLPIVVTVLNNRVLGYQRDAEERRFGQHTDACDLLPVDHAAIARACGCRGIRIERAEDYLPALEEAVKADVTTVLDVMSDPSAYPPVTEFEPKASA